MIIFLWLTRGGLAIFWNKELKIGKILFTDFTIEVKITANQESDS